MARLIYPLTESVLEKADLNAAIKVINSTKITMGEKTKQIENYFLNNDAKVTRVSQSALEDALL